MDHPYSQNYTDYYLKENPKQNLQYENDKNLLILNNCLQNISHKQKTNKYSNSNKDLQENNQKTYIFEQNPIDLPQWVNILLSQPLTQPLQNQMYPIMFEKTKLIVRIFELLIYGIKRQATQISDILTQKKPQNLKIHNQMEQEGDINDFQIQSKHIISNLNSNFENYPLMYHNIFESNNQEYINQGPIPYNILLQNNDKILKTFVYIVNKKVTEQEVENYQPYIQNPIYEIFRYMKEKISQNLYQHIPLLGYQLINRLDIYQNLKLFKIYPQQNNSKKLFKYNITETINNIVNNNKNKKIILNLNLQNKESNNLLNISKNGSETSSSQKFFNNTNQIIFEEVERLLDTLSDIKISKKCVDSIPEEKLEIEGQIVLKKFVMRRLSCFIGQGAFTFATWNTNITELVKIPKVNLSGILPNQVKIKFEYKEENSNLTLWSDFSNGVAAGLKLSKEVLEMNPENLKTWIFYQRPETLDYEHGGFLLGIGLLGYLGGFSPTDIFQYLKNNHEITCIGMLLGLSASKIGKPDESTAKTLCLHIPFILPPHCDVVIPINVQTAAMIGIGLLNKGTNTRLFSEMALAQIGRKPISDQCLDRESFSLAAGFSLGLINLSKGVSHPNIKDLQLEERLIRYIEGGSIMQSPQSMLSSNFNNDVKCSSIKENSQVNTHITGQGALIALGLIFLKSNNMDISKRIQIPNSFATIENCNPNLILMKTCIKNLIMWDTIEATDKYIYSQIPSLITYIYENSFQEVYEKYYLVYNVYEIDFATVTSIYTSIIGGTIMSIGLKFAGTGNQEAVQTISNHINKFRKMKTSACDLSNDPTSKNTIDQYSLFTLLSISLLSLSLINAGTCDVQSLKLCRIIRKKFQDQGVFHYGFNMAINMAIGFLCLGKGQYSFKRDDLSISALLISIYPYFPNSPNDNKYHLQALRHFYVLAVEQKVFNAIDIESGDIVNAQIKVAFLHKNQIQVQQFTTPILLQDSKNIISICIADDDFYNSQMMIKPDTICPNQIYVKKRRNGKIIDNTKQQEIKMIGLRNVDIQKFFQMNKQNLYYDNNYQLLKNLQKISYQQGKMAQNYLINNGISINSNNIQLSSQQQEEIQNYNFQIQQDYYKIVVEDRLQFLNYYLMLKNHNLMELSLKQLNNFQIIQAFYKNPLVSKLLEFNEHNISLNYFYDILIKKVQIQNLDQLKDQKQQNYQDNNQIKELVKQVKIEKISNLPSQLDQQGIQFFVDKMKVILNQNKSLNQQQFAQVKNQVESMIKLQIQLAYPNINNNTINYLLELYPLD